MELSAEPTDWYERCFLVKIFIETLLIVTVSELCLLSRRLMCVRLIYRESLSPLLLLFLTNQFSLAAGYEHDHC